MRSRGLVVAALGLLATSAWAEESPAGWEGAKRWWSAEIGLGFALSGDTTGNVRDIPRPYAAGEPAGDLPLGFGFDMRHVLRIPVGAVEPALLVDLGVARTGSGGTFEDYGDYATRATRVDLLAGPGVCFEPDGCLFAAYGYRQLDLGNDNLAVGNLQAVLGDRDEYVVDSFVQPYLSAVLGQGLVDLLLASIDFEDQRVSVDLVDRLTMRGGMLAFVAGARHRVTVDGAVGYYAVRQTHETGARVIADVEEDPDAVTTFDYAWEKGLGVLPIDLQGSVGVLPDGLPVQLAVGVRGSVWTVIDLDPDRTVGSHLHAGAFVSTKW